MLQKSQTFASLGVNNTATKVTLKVPPKVVALTWRKGEGTERESEEEREIGRGNALTTGLINKMQMQTKQYNLGFYTNI